jgi:hypothetical protein
MTEPQDMALRLVHFMYFARGVLAKNLYSNEKMANPVTWEMTADEMPTP